MIIRLKKFLNKYKNRIFSFIAVFAFIPLFGFNAYAYSPENLGDCAYPVRFLDKPYMAIFKTGGIVYQTIYDVTTVNSTYPNNVPNQSISYNFTNPNYNINNGVKRIWFENSVSTLDFLYQPDLYDTYLYVTLSSGSIDNFSFRPDSMHILSRTGNTTSTYQLIDLLVMNYASATRGGFTACGKLPVIDNSTFNGFYFVDTGGGTVGADIIMEGIFILLPKDSSAEQLQSVITAINSQTSSLGGKLDGVQSGINQGNNLIDKGNSSTSGIVSGNNSAVDNLDSVVSEYRATEEAFFNDFTSNQQAITSDIVGWSWGGLVNCANWVGETMTDYYNNMGDFRQYIIYPLMLGIALFFLGRGGSIIGHLFRKPTQTTVNTKSVFRREGNTRYTTTTTSRQGGVFRR